jgi:hypothetical protein
MSMPDEHEGHRTMTNEPSVAVSKSEIPAAEATVTEQPFQTADGPLFDRDTLKQFEADDQQAGGNIGKMLALFFLYTVIVMSIVAAWTFYVSAD